MVQRPRLIERMSAGLYGTSGNFASKLTLVSAPAGYGKTTLVAEWLPSCPPAIQLKNILAFLDQLDNETSRFFSYLIAALQKIDPAIGAELQPILNTDADYAIEPILTALVNDIADWGSISRPGRQFILVIDDYYFVTEFNIHEALDFLIDHIPSCMHLVL